LKIHKKKRDDNDVDDDSYYGLSEYEISTFFGPSFLWKAGTTLSDYTVMTQMNTVRSFRSTVTQATGNTMFLLKSW
jgi:hypothetical protein